MLKEVGNFIQKMLFKHWKNFRGDSLNFVWRQGCKKWHFYSYKWPYWPGSLNTIASSSFDRFSRSNLPKHLNFDISKAPIASNCLEKVFVIAYNSYVTKCSWITSKPNTLLLRGCLKVGFYHMKEDLKWLCIIPKGAQRCFWVLVKLWDPRGPQGTPPEVSSGPESVYEEPIDTRHVGYQFSQFLVLKTNTGSIHI